ncbi:NAD(P)-binding protein [Propionibacterium australiense]|uniref:FAD-binding protein n=1 Tax=Propionibacterium australiense TaxID=119981 RepID=A0A383S7Y6_9ACTN|nr:NAD(P)-binding protein [Propionibacterium australiense]RLP06756.1 FAD-binding protein [Propionibacterium australiense]RLP07484.1 FAD-binding protein [Propionibacterium australiense]SYZ34088.1 Pyridine nucleotide disulphide reductase class-II signature [Propionibacterium australiense]VEH88670.1 NAD-dependent dihydropyrimidine dehydrogenase sunbunit PreT [Propionibacterium australiense]
MTTERSDITMLPDLASSAGRVGPVRTRMPIYVDLLPPCNNACPAGENCQEWLRLVKETDPENAWRQLVRDNPFPAIHGRVCYHPCETACNRGELDQSVSIHSVERYLGDMAIERGWKFNRPRNNTGYRVLVIGAGPAGLSAAYHLARLGHEVEIHDAGEKAGGMMRYGIPEYRLPRDVVDAEIARVEELGVRIVLNHPVEDLLAEQRDGNFDAVFVAIGAHLSRRVEIPSMDAGRMVDAVEFLRGVARGDKPVIGRRVAVYGGGNTAMDAARVARRLGAEDAVIIYRRTEEQMPAHKEELDEAEREGVQMHWLRTINQMDAEGVEVEVMELDESGRPHGTGRFERLAADTVIMAVGQVADTGFLQKIPGMQFNGDVVRVDPTTLMTDVPGIFAGGDAVPSERTVTVGVGHGKRAARQIDTWLNHQAPGPRVKHPIVHFDDLHLWYFGDHPREVQAELDPSERIDFGEVVKGLTEDEAIFEARRCLSCGNCFECDGCFGSCPEDAIIKLGKGHRYRFDYEKCTGCGTCYEQCPVHAIEMIPER